MPDVILTPNEAAALLINTVLAILAGGFAGAPITLFLVSVLKRLPFLSNTRGEVIQFAVGLALTAVFWIATALGFERQFRDIVDFILISGPAALTLIVSLFGSSELYKGMMRANVPLLGYSRTPVNRFQATRF